MALAILVEGHMEQRIVQRLCAGVKVQRLGINGKDVLPEAIAKRAAPLVRLLKNYRPIIIIFDRETREESCLQIETRFREALLECGVDRNDLIVAIPDQMIENWILSCDTFRAQHDISADLCSEGVNGKARMAAEFQKKGVSYHNTVDGVDLFCQLRVESVASRSQSFRRFRESASAHCDWLAGPARGRSKRKRRKVSSRA